MAQLFRRVVNVTVAPKTTAGGTGITALENSLGFDLSNLDCTFSAKKSLKPEPNTCELKLFNLQETTRKVLEIPKKLVLRLEAGYEGAVSQIYFGEVASAHSHWEGSDCITEISTGDSEKELATSRINLSVGPKMGLNVALLKIATALGVGQGNAAVVAAKLAGKTPFGLGGAIAGNAARALTDICLAADLEWSIQDGAIQILDRGKALDALAVDLSPDTGLIGSPTVDHKGILSATALLQPDLRPGRKVSITAKSLRGGFRIQTCEYTGDTSIGGKDWYVKFTAKKY